MNKIEKILKDSKISFKKDEKMAGYTTTKVGGKARYFIACTKEDDLIKIFNLVIKNDFNYLIIGGGSNLLISDKDFNGIVILNRVDNIFLNKNIIRVSSGALLSSLVSFSASNGLGGIEELMGIPGTVGGAIYGNAGAYGNYVSNNLLRVKVSDGKKVFWIEKNKMSFSYRDSDFKKQRMLILEAEFKLQEGDSKQIVSKTKDILKDRENKYKKGVYCPGSFFKNIEAKNLSKEILSKIPKEKIVYGKIPAGYLLESVNAKGFRMGKIEVSKEHANFFINKGDGKAKDYYRLAMFLRKEVLKKYGINLEPEVQVINFKK